jgi:hypothetical protein
MSATGWGKTEGEGAGTNRGRQAATRHAALPPTHREFAYRTPGDYDERVGALTVR